MISLRQQRRRDAEQVVPMINVAFLLLVFFLMSAVIAPPVPVEITAPVSASADSPSNDAPVSLLLDGDRRLLDASGAQVEDLAALSGKALRLRAEATLAASDLARVLAALAAAGSGPVELVAVRP